MAALARRLTHARPWHGVLLGVRHDRAGPCSLDSLNLFRCTCTLLPYLYPISLWYESRAMRYPGALGESVHLEAARRQHLMEPISSTGTRTITHVVQLMLPQRF